MEACSVLSWLTLTCAKNSRHAAAALVGKLERLQHPQPRISKRAATSWDLEPHGEGKKQLPAPAPKQLVRHETASLQRLLILDIIQPGWRRWRRVFAVGPSGKKHGEPWTSDQVRPSQRMDWRGGITRASSGVGGGGVAIKSLTA